jgi:hypothetical protein
MQTAVVFALAHPERLGMAPGGSDSPRLRTALTIALSGYTLCSFRG